MTANLTFVISKKDDVIRIPNAAFRYSPASRSGRTERKFKFGNRRETAPLR